MSVFWKYFTKDLKFIPFLKEGNTQLVGKGAASHLDETRDRILWLREQFIPLLCDEGMLPYFAESRGIVKAPSETQEQYYQRIRYAYAWFVLGGRETGVDISLRNYFGYESVGVYNLRQDDEDRWAEFDVMIGDVSGEQLNYVNETIWAINEIKPARSKLSQLRYTAPVTQGTEYFGGVLTSEQYMKIYSSEI